MDIVELIQNSVGQFLDRPARHIVIAHSGGLDSQVLLHAVASQQRKYPQHQFSVCHVHHGLSQQAEAWLEFCRDQAQRYQMPFHFERVNLTENTTSNIEARARQARYRVFSEYAGASATVMTAHHQNDQAETFFLRLARGAGGNGLKGMKAQRQLSKDVLLERPLLSFTRQQLADYGQQAQLDWVEDESNQDTRFDRNFVRQKIIPQFEQRWPDMVRQIGQSCDWLTEQQSMLEEVLSKRLASVQGPDNYQLSIAKLKSFDVKWQKHLLRYWFEQNTQQALPKTALQELMVSLLSTAPDGQPKIVVGNYILRRFRDELWLTQKTTELALQRHPIVSQFTTLEPGDCEIEIADKSIFQQGFEVGHGYLSELFKPQGKPHHKPVKRWLREWGVPAWQRQQVVFVWHENELVELVTAVGHFSVSGKNVIQRVRWREQ